MDIKLVSGLRNCFLLIVYKTCVNIGAFLRISTLNFLHCHAVLEMQVCYFLRSVRKILLHMEGAVGRVLKPMNAP